MASKNRFEINGDTVHIFRDGWEHLASTSYRDDYIDELQSVTWGITNGYLRSNKLGYLHRYVVGKWYGTYGNCNYHKLDKSNKDIEVLITNY